MTDDHILKALQARDPKALDLLMSKYDRYVYNVIAYILGSAGEREDVEELRSDTFYALWLHAETIAPGKLKPYLCAAARNKAKDFLRKQKPLPEAPDFLEIPDLTGSPEDNALQEELARRLRGAIHRLPPKDREIFLRHYYYMQTTEQISAQMHIPVGTVCSRLARGRKKLKTILEKEVLL